MTHRIAILGGGVGGTLLANLLRKDLSRSEAQISIIDTTGRHVYEPGWLYLPFGAANPKQLVKPEHRLLRSGIDLRIGHAEHIDTAARTIRLTEGDVISFDTLVLSTGAVLAPEAVPGFSEGAQHFYSEEAALRLKIALDQFTGGKLVVGVADIPYKCPPAPLEFVLMVEDYLTKRGVRDKTQITDLSPINRAFTIESVSAFVTPILAQRGISVELFFNTESIDPIRKQISSMEGTTVDYDLLVLVPPHRGAPVIRNSGLGDELGWIPTDRHTLEVKGQEGIYALGDGTDVPVSKSGSAAHFEAKVLSHRIVHRVNPTKHGADACYDGKVLCFLETGHGKASQLVFDFEHAPKPPAPNTFYHYEKLLFNKVYWYIVPKGIV